MASKVTIPGVDVPWLIGNNVNPDWYTVLKFLEKLNPLSDIDNTALIANILATVAATYSPILRTVSTKTGTTYAFLLADSGGYFRFANANPVTVTIQPHSTIAAPIGTQYDGIQAGAGKVTFAAGAGVTINSYLSNKSLAGNGAAFSLVQSDTLDTWDLVGSLIP